MKRLEKRQMKKVFITALVAMTLVGTQAQASTEEVWRVADSAVVVGATAGYTAAVVVAPVTALGWISVGSGFGTTIGPVGTVIGAVIGLAGYGVYKVFNDKGGK